MYKKVFCRILKNELTADTENTDTPDYFYKFMFICTTACYDPPAAMYSADKTVSVKLPQQVAAKRRIFTRLVVMPCWGLPMLHSYSSESQPS